MKENTHLQELITRYPVLEQCRGQIRTAFEIIRDSYKAGGMLLACGNGGSGADSEHLVGELMKEFVLKRPLMEDMKKRLKEVSPEHGELLGSHLQGALPAITLTSNIALSTAYANDAVPELVFAQQVYGYGTPESVLVGISTSGNSRNVIYALETAKVLGMKTVGMTGAAGGKVAELCDICICVPEQETFKVQELHLPVYHALCLMLEDTFFGEEAVL